MTVVHPGVASGELFDQLAPGLDAQTINVIERHRNGGIVKGRGWLVRRALALADMVGLTVAFAVAMVWWGGSPTDDHVADGLELVVFMLSLPVWILAANLYGLYSSDEERTDHSTPDDLVGVFHLVTVGSWVLFLGITFTEVANPSLQRLITFWLLAILLITSFRALARAVCRRTDVYLQNTVIVGAGDVGQLVGRKLRHHPEYGLNVVGFVDAQPKERQPGLGDMNLLGPPERLAEIVPLLHVERVIIAFSNDSHEETLDLIRSHRGSRRPDRHRASSVRGDRCQCRLAHRRGAADDRSSDASALPVCALHEATARRRDLAHRARPSLSPTRRDRHRNQARLGWTRFLPAGSEGRRKPRLQHLQVPDDGHGRRGAEG